MNTQGGLGFGGWNNVNKKVFFAIIILLLTAFSLVMVAFFVQPAHHSAPPPMTNVTPSPSPSASPPPSAFVAPEYAWGGLVSLLACFGALALFKGRRKQVQAQC